MKRLLGIASIILILFSFPFLATSQEKEKPGLCTIIEMYIAGIPAHSIEKELLVPQDWLKEGELVIEGEASEKVEKVEVTLDGGKTWIPAKGTKSWYYTLQPLPRESFKIGSRAWCAGKATPPYRRRFFKVSYTGKTSRKILDNIFKKIELYYQGKNRLQFMKLFSRKKFHSPLYRNYRELEVQVRNDFQWGSGMEYRFYIDQVLRTENIFIVQTHWYLTYTGLIEPKEGYTEFHFDPGNQWKIVDIRGDKPFGIIEEPEPDLEIAEDEIQGYSPDNYTFHLTIPVHNRGRIAARRVVVKAECSNAFGSGSASKTIKAVPIMGIKVVTLDVTGMMDFYYSPPTCTITVDPQNRIPELNEDNNQVQKTF